jgi:hypothetical protein
MNRFKKTLRIEVIDPEHPMYGETGRVVQVLYDSSAWCRMDKKPPENLARYVAGVRSYDVRLEPDKCFDHQGDEVKS